MKTALTGIKPTAMPHLGNYLGAIRPALELSQDYRCFYFIADYHALTTVHEPQALRNFVYDVAATWIACGLNPDQALLYRQSAIPEVFELMWILSCFLATGQLERGHAYKDAIARGEAPNAGVFAYPVLMAADILLFDTAVVPVGIDQKQHLELTRDIATRINHHFGDNTLVVPEIQIQSEIVVPGKDGRKMSKSYGNTLPLFAPSKELRANIMKIKTGSEELEAPKPAEGTTLFDLFRMVATPQQAMQFKDKLEAGGFGWGHAKQELYELLEKELAPKRDVFNALRSDEQKLNKILTQSEEKARKLAQSTMTRVRKAMGVR